MSDEEPKKSNIHFHLGGVIILIIIVFVLLKVDMKKTVESPRFQSNITYIKAKTEDVWQQYLSKPILYIWNNLFSDLISKGVQMAKDKAVEQIQGVDMSKYNLGAPTSENTQTKK